MSIASLEAELSRQQSINYELRSELNTIASGVNRAYERLENERSKIANALDHSNNMLEQSKSKMAMALETQYEIESLYVRFKAMELANKQIRACNNKKYYEFGNYRTVRKIVQGLMDNLDMNLVSEQIIYKTVEKEHLKTPDYWLTCVLLSVMAWQTDDKYLADRAMAIALQLDKKDSAIFYMLFNLRMDRESAALKWFEQYQQCELKGSDQKTFLLLFSLISRTLNASDEISQAAKGEIRDYIDRIIRQTISSEGYSREDMVTRAVNHMDAFVPGEQGNYPLLRRYCKDYPRLNAALMQAKSNVELLDYYKKLLHVPPEERNLFIKGFIDELIASANDQEKAVYEEIAYNETIIRCEGDVDKAKEIFGNQKIHDENQLNLISEMIDWVYGVDKENVSGQSRLNMFNLTRDLQIEGIQARTQRYRAMDRSHVQATINDYSTAMDLNDQAGETMKADAFYRGKRDETLSQIKDWPAFIGFGAGVAGIVGGIAVAPVIFAAAAIGAGYGVFKLLSNRSERKQAENRYQQDSAACGKIISDLCREHEALEQEFGGYDAYAQGILQELESA